MKANTIKQKINRNKQCNVSNFVPNKKTHSVTKQVGLQTALVIAAYLMASMEILGRLYGDREPF